MKDTEDQFKEIIQRCVEEMERVDCPMEEYLDGLKSARSRFADLVQMVKEELERG
jgi:hypothetical protein